MKPTLGQVFGLNSTQDQNFLTIPKADLISTGLVSATTNTPGSLMVAILLKSANYLNTNNQIVNPNIQVTIQQLPEQPIVRRYGAYYRQVSFVINLHKSFNNQIDPDNY